MGLPDDTKRIAFPIAAFVLVLADQVSKHLAVQRGSYVLNTGISFGAFQGANAVMSIVATLAMLLFIYLLAFRDKEFHSDVGLILLIAGTAGNLIDRLTLGAVIDWISVTPRFATFNLADSMLTLGILIILYATLRYDVLEKRKRATRR